MGVGADDRLHARLSHKRTSRPTTRAPSGGRWTIRGMAQNFIDCDREQPFLLPPDVREWLPEDHLVWFVIDAVG